MGNKGVKVIKVGEMGIKGGDGNREGDRNKGGVDGE